MVQEYLSPGAYGQEITPATLSAGLSPSICGMVGWTTKGPANTAIRVRGVEEFRRRFGDLNNVGTVAICSRAFFGNGGQDLVVVRVTPADAVSAAVDVDAPAKWTFTAKGAGVWGNDLAVLVRGNNNYLDRTAGAETYTRFDVLVLQPFDFDATIEVASEVYEAVQFTDSTGASYFPNVIDDDRASSQLLDVLVGLGGNPAGLAGTNIAGVSVGTGPGANYTGTFAALPILDLTVVISANLAAPFVSGPTIIHTDVGGLTHDLSTTPITTALPLLPGATTIDVDIGAGPVTQTDDGVGNFPVSPELPAGGTVNYVTGALTGVTAALLAASTISETHNQAAGVALDDGLGNLIGTVDPSGTNTINYTTGAFDVTFLPVIGAVPVIASYRQQPTQVRFDLAGGTDGTSVGRSVVSAPALEASKLGIYAFDSFEEPLNVVVPDFEGSTSVQADLITFAKARQDRYLILGMSNAATVAETVQYVLVTQAGVFDEAIASFYYPNVRYVREDTDVVQTVPVTAFVAGVYARTAEIKNIGKSPAGIEDGAVAGPGVVGPELDLDLSARDTLYQARINPVYRSLATGYAVWGDRTLSLELRWRNANSRLLHNFLMFRIQRLLSAQVFESNGPGLWALIQQSISGFMTSLFELGYFSGLSASQAYFVRCDDTNNNSSTISARQVYVDIGFAPNTPAEFIIFRLQQPVTTGTVV